MRLAKRHRWIWAVLGTVLVVGVAIWQWPRTQATPAKPVVVVVSGDTAGWLIPCGCTANQSGGLLRRATYLNKVSEESDVLYLDAGGAASGNSDYFRVKFEAILRGELAMNVAAHNIGGSEIALGPDYIRQIGRELNVPFVSANCRDSAGALVGEPYRIIERNGLKIAVAGVLSKRYASKSCRIEDPREAALDVARQVKGRADRLIVLAYLPEDELRTFTTGFPEADAIIGGPTGQSIVPQTLGSTMFASATNKGKFLIRLDGWQDKQLSGEVVELNPSFADDPNQEANVRRYLGDLGSRDFSAANSGVRPPLPSRLPADYRVAGNSSCQSCHGQDCSSWAASKHAHAWSTLTQRGYHVDSYCQQCHTNGFAMPGGFESVGKSELLHSVGCESCHGPSHSHSKNPKVRTSFVAKDQCVVCHDRENSPTFEYESFWAKVRHGAPATTPKGEAK
jgi:hypothetical protein